MRVPAAVRCVCVCRYSSRVAACGGSECVAVLPPLNRALAHAYTMEARVRALFTFGSGRSSGARVLPVGSHSADGVVVVLVCLRGVILLGRAADNQSH